MVRRDECFAVRGERRARQKVARIATLLVVAIHCRHQPALVTRRELDELESGHAVTSSTVDQPLAIAARYRAKRARRLFAALEQPAGRPFEQRELPLSVAARGRGGHPGVPRVAAERDAEDASRARQAWVCGRRWSRAARHLHTAAAARAMVHEQLVVGDNLRALRGDDVLPVGGPRGGDEGGSLVARDGARVPAVGVHRPDVLGAGPIAHEGDGLSVGRPAGLRIERDAAGDSCRPAAGNGQGVEVAKQIEDERPSVRRDVE